MDGEHLSARSKLRIIIWSGWKWAIEDGDLDADLTVWSAGGAPELERSESIGMVWVHQVLESEGADEGLGRFGGFGVEDFDGEEGIVEGEGEEDDEVLVPSRVSGAGIVGFGGESVIRVNPEDDVGFEVVVAPVHVLEMLHGNDHDVEIERLRW
ncbi:hypothetical protein U1Q18_030227 [Sarracenia purpurea var. burkii]